MKEVPFWAVKDITRNDSAREERNEIPHYNDKPTLKLKCCLIYYNRRYRSVYWLKYHAAGFSSMRVHVQFAHYIKKFELLIWMVNPVLNQLYLKKSFCTFTHCMLYFPLWLPNREIVDQHWQEMKVIITVQFLTSLFNVVTFLFSFLNWVW